MGLVSNVVFMLLGLYQAAVRAVLSRYVAAETGRRRTKKERRERGRMCRGRDGKGGMKRERERERERADVSVCVCMCVCVCARCKRERARAKERQRGEVSSHPSSRRLLTERRVERSERKGRRACCACVRDVCVRVRVRVCAMYSALPALGGRWRGKRRAMATDNVTLFQTEGALARPPRTYTCTHTHTCTHMHTHT